MYQSESYHEEHYIDIDLSPYFASVKLLSKFTAPNNNRVLDYGCGVGLCVEEGLRRGIDIWGADIFEWDEDILGEDYHGKLPEHLIGKVLEIRLDTLASPYPNTHFDFVYCNMVFEHVENIDRALSEIARVLKPDGEFFAAFPGKESLVEAHVRIPFIHWIPKNASFRMWYMTMMRRLGLGAGGEGKGPREWAEKQLKYIDKYTFYRTRREIAGAYASAGFNIKNIEGEASLRTDSITSDTQRLTILTA